MLLIQDRQQMVQESSEQFQENDDDGLIPLPTKRFSQFPKGRWIIRWVGKRVAPRLNSFTPRMELLLCKVPDGIKFEDYVPYSDIDPELKFLVMTVGELPHIRLNSGFDDGVCAYVQPSEFLILRINASRLKRKRERIKLFQNGKLNQYGWFDVFEGNDSNGAVTVYLPCWEVLRSIYTPTSHFAKTLLGFPGDVAINKLVDLNCSSIDLHDESIWNLVVRFQTLWKWRIHAGFFALDPIARQAANEVYFTASGEDGYIGASLPFEDDYLEIKIRKVKQPDPNRQNRRHSKIYATEILFVGWNCKALLNVEIERSGVDGTAPFGNKPTPYSSGVVLNGNASEILISDSDPDRSAGSAVVHRRSGTSALFAKNIVTVDVIRDAVTSFDNRLEISKETSNAASSSDRGSGNKGVAQISNDQDSNLPATEFELVFDAFKKLKLTGHITNFEIYESPDGRGAYRSGFPVWIYPGMIKHIKKNGDEVLKPINFSWVDYEKDQPRTFLVLRIEIKNRLLFWIETEHKYGKGIRSVLVAGRPLDNERIIKIRDQIVSMNGAVGVDKDLDLFGEGFGFVWSWTHDYPNKTEVGNEKYRELNEVSMLNKIYELFDI